MARTRVHPNRPAEEETAPDTDTVVDPERLAADSDSDLPPTPPSPSTRAREAEAAGTATKPTQTPQDAPEASVAPAPPAAPENAPTPPPGAARYRVWAHGALRRNGVTHQPGDELVLPVEVGDAIVCLSRID